MMRIKPSSQTRIAVSSKCHGKKQITNQVEASQRLRLYKMIKSIAASSKTGIRENSTVKYDFS
jgi:hypothetical protein